MASVESEINHDDQFGPQHPAAHGVLRMVMEMDGEVVERIDPHIGLLHRGTEKLIEHKTYMQAIPCSIVSITSRRCARNTLSYWQRRGSWALNRRVAGNLSGFCSTKSRILNHLLNVPALMDVGAMTPMLWAFEQRELMSSTSAFAGTTPCRLLPGRRRPSGYANRDGGRYTRMDRSVPEVYRRYGNAAYGKPHFQATLCRYRLFPQMMRWRGDLGPMLRGSGVAWDLRKATYDVYGEIDFDIPIGKNGDCYDRYLVRVEEMRQA